jgi:hypothetical protein
MVLSVPVDTIQPTQMHTEEMTVSGKLFVINLSPAMDEDTRLIQAWMGTQLFYSSDEDNRVSAWRTTNKLPDEITEKMFDLIKQKRFIQAWEIAREYVVTPIPQKIKPGRSGAIATAIEHLHKAIRVISRERLQILIDAYILDTQASPPGSRHPHGIWLTHESGEMLDDIGRHLEFLGNRLLPEDQRLHVPKLKASKGNYNRAQLIYFALREFTSPLREDEDLEPLPARDPIPHHTLGGRKPEDDDGVLGKYPEVTEMLRRGMNPNEINKVKGTPSLNTIKKVKAILDGE